MVRKLHTFLLHSFIMATATLVVAAISIISLYFGLLELVNENVIKGISIGSLQMPFFIAGGIALVTTVVVMSFASVIYFRMTLPMAKKIEQQAETFHTLVNTAREGVFLVDTSGIIQFANPAAERLFGYAHKELLGVSVNQLMPPPHRDKHDDYIRRYLQTGKKRIIGTGRQLVGQRKDETQFPMYLSLGEIKLDHAHLFAGMVMDMSEQQKLQREVLAIPIREQRRIGEELHDGLGQQLTGLSMLAQSLLNNASKPEYDLANQIANGLNEALTQVKALSHGLMPAQVNAKTFPASLQQIIDNIEQQSHVPIYLHIDNVVQFFDDATASHLYRIVQESLNNAIKHADASQIDVTLKVEQDHGVLEITDNGIGLPDNVHDSTGLGLHIMKHRCGLFDGEITINPDHQQGTKVCCRFPLTSEEEH